MKATMLLTVAVICGIMTVTCNQMGVAESVRNLSYGAKCETCHGSKGLADTSPGKLFHVKPFTDPTILAMPDTALRQAIIDGSGKMPAYKGKLPDGEVSDLIKFIHQLQTSQ